MVEDGERDVVRIERRASLSSKVLRGHGARAVRRPLALFICKAPLSSLDYLCESLREVSVSPHDGFVLSRVIAEIDVGGLPTQIEAEEVCRWLQPAQIYSVVGFLLAQASHIDRGSD